MLARINQRQSHLTAPIVVIITILFASAPTSITLLHVCMYGIGDVWRGVFRKSNRSSDGVPTICVHSSRAAVG
jgi:ABC-type multidrug transport system permease subunit